MATRAQPNRLSIVFTTCSSMNHLLNQHLAFSSIALNLIYSGGLDAAAGGRTQWATCAVHAMQQLI